MLKLRAFTLVEMMISLSISSISIVATTSFIASTATSLHKLDQVSRLQNELNTLASVLYEDIRNTGYDGLALERLSDDSIASSPFQSKPVISNFDGESPQSCILFTHDINDDGSLNESTPNERRGYRLRDGALEVRIGGRNCEQTGWQDLTSNEFIRINELKFESHALQQNSIAGLSLSFTITASLSLDASIKRSLQVEIPIYNADK